MAKGAAAVLLVAPALAMLAGEARADRLMLTPEGLARRQELEEALAPAPLYEEDGQAYFVGVIVDAKQAEDPSAPMKSVEGQPTYRFIAFDKDGGRRSQPRTLSALWFKVRSDVDALMDLRRYASNRDVLLGTQIGSRRYIEGLLAALDPTGELGLSDGQAGEAPEGLVEGALVESLRNPQRWQDPQYVMSCVNAAVAERRPVFALPVTLRTIGPANVFAHHIARARRYPVFEPGFENAALALLVLQCDLALVDPEISDYARRVHEHGVETAQMMVALVGSGPAPANRPPVPPRPLPATEFATGDVDMEGVALDALRLSRAPFALHRHGVHGLVWGCVELAASPSEAHFELRDKSAKLLARLLKAPRARNAAEEETFARAAAAFRADLESAFGMAETRPRVEAAVAAFDTAGWEATESMLRIAEGKLSYALTTAREIVLERPDPQGRDLREVLRHQLWCARVLSVLAQSEDADEQRIGRVVLDAVDRLASLEEPGQDVSLVLREWEALQER